MFCCQPEIFSEPFCISQYMCGGGTCMCVMWEEARKQKQSCFFLNVFRLPVFEAIILTSNQY